MDTRKIRFINFRPAVILTAGFIFGLLVGYAFTFISKPIAVIIFILAVLGFILVSAVQFFKRARKSGFFTLLLVASIILGSVLLRVDAKNSYKVEGVSNFQGVVSEIYEETEIEDGYYYSALLKGDFLDVTGVKVYAKFISPKRAYQGIKIKFSGYFTLNDEDDNFTFSTEAKYSVKVNNGSVKVGEFYGIIPTLKYKLLTTLETFTPKTFYLNYALLTGETIYIPESKIVNYQNVGVAHLFAVSGLHIGLLYGVLLILFKAIKLKPKYRFLLTFTIILFYVGFCGFSSSSIRAFVIISIRELSYLLGLKPDKTTNLSISALIVLAINPSELFSVGFLLSYSVYLGLILLSAPLTKTLSKIFPSKVATVISPCVIAELVSLPILIDFFRNCSPFGFLFNALIIPIVSLLYPLILLSVLMLLIFQFSAFAIIPNLAFGVIDFLLNSASTDMFMLSGFRFAFSVIPYYLLLYSFTGKVNLNRKLLIILRIIVLSACILTFCAVNF